MNDVGRYGSGEPGVAAPGSGDLIQSANQLEKSKGGEEAGKLQVLTDEDANDLCEDIDRSLSGLPTSIAASIDLDDLGLPACWAVLASRRFDPGREVAFGGYAQYWIRGEITRLFKLKDGAPRRAVIWMRQTSTRQTKS